LPDQAERSELIWATVRALDVVDAAATVMAFTSIAGEPDTARFIEWCTARGKRVVVPEDRPDPGCARLGQGGGWYDRFLAAVREDCTAIGVGFDAQVLDALPVESHDVRLDVIVTESGSVGRSDAPVREEPR
jgi:5-formyltetrahydrofolate cyclo-ligase